jgi:putative copper export protein
MLAATHLAPGLTIVRLSLHVLAASIWIGGQIVMAGLVPTLREAGQDVPSKAARAFARLSWPAFAVLVITGFWNYAVEIHGTTTYGWQMVMGVKFVAVFGAGAGAWLHTRATTPSKRGMWAGIGLLGSLLAMVLGVTLAG